MPRFSAAFPLFRRSRSSCQVVTSTRAQHQSSHPTRTSAGQSPYRFLTLLFSLLLNFCSVAHRQHYKSVSAGIGRPTTVLLCYPGTHDLVEVASANPHAFVARPLISYQVLQLIKRPSNRHPHQRPSFEWGRHQRARPEQLETTQRRLSARAPPRQQQQRHRYRYHRNPHVYPWLLTAAAARAPTTNTSTPPQTVRAKTAWRPLLVESTFARA